LVNWRNVITIEPGKCGGKPCIRTRDGDHARLAQEQGEPPRVVGIRVGNCATDSVEALRRARRAEIGELDLGRRGLMLELP
jgi:predicted nuclease of predicted toxin-antitoxin system